MEKPSSPAGFWNDTLQAMHPSVRVRYYQWFVMAHAMDRTFDDVLALWRNANDAAVRSVREVLG